MKKKLLTVLLAVVMVFGVFSLTACGGSNPDEDYNYYGIKYELEDVRIQAATFQGVYKMFTTPGSFLLYVDSESDGAKARFAAINDLANEWDVTIYHFNPDLSGGYAKSVTGAKSANILKTDIYGAGIETVQKTLEAISGKKVADLKDNALWGIKGADSTANADGTLKYNGKLSAQVAYAAEADYSAALACTQTVPSYGDKKGIAKYVKDVVNTMNLYGDARLHMYNDDNGVDALKDAKEDVYVTVANYAMFEHLLLNNEGYFPVFFGGTWCPNTQAIVKATDKLAKDYGIEKIYFFDPRLEDGTKIDAVKETKVYSSEKAAEDELKAQLYYAELQEAVLADEMTSDEAEEAMATYTEEMKASYGYNISYAVVENSAYLASALNTRNTDADNQWKDLSDLNKIKEYVKAIKTNISGEDFKAEYVRDFDDDTMQAAIDNAMIAAQSVVSAAIEEKVKETYTESEWTALTALEKVTALINKQFEADKKVINDNTALTAAQKKEQIAALASNPDKIAIDALTVLAGTKLDADVKADAEAAYKKSVFNYSFLYGTFLDNYIKWEDGSSYASMWNIGSALKIGSKTYTKMCVPNIMMFNGEGEGAAKLVALAEAEYTYANVNEEGNAQQIAWDKAVKAVFDANPYAKYAPIVVAPEAAAPEASAPAAGGSSAPAAGGDAC